MNTKHEQYIKLYFLGNFQFSMKTMEKNCIKQQLINWMSTLYIRFVIKDYENKKL